MRRFNLPIRFLFIGWLILVGCTSDTTPATSEPGTTETSPPVEATDTGEATEPTAEPQNPTAVLNAQQMLAEQLDIDVATITVVNVEAVDWPDACLGVVVEGEGCAQVITPGYRVILEAAGQLYEFHTDQEGVNIRLAETTTPVS